ncbi:uncharacterized protein LOC135342214 [Halichondria panicea]|uniref:uncharacterized protein LOC135342214 n=1 Tax=Halichondria panicea TaxID=6063 RepID=UPI00312B3087
MNEKDVLENESELRPTTEEDLERVEEEVVEISGEGIDELAENSSTEETVTPRTVVQSTTQKKKDVLENESELRPITEEDSERVEEEVMEISREGSDELAEHSSTEETVTPRTAEQSTTQKKKVSWWKLTAIAAGSVVGGATVVAAAPLVVAGLGFTAGGIASGSIAASMMSAMAPTMAGGIVATLQSVGAAGFSAAGVAALAGAGGTAGAAVTAALASRRENENESSEIAEDETT